MSPHVVARAVHAERQVQAQAAPLGPHPFPRLGELLVREPLREQVIAAGGLGLGRAREPSLSRAGRPGSPPRAAAVDLDAEARVVAHLGALGDEAPVRGGRAAGEEPLGERLERAALGRRDGPVVDQGRRLPPRRRRAGALDVDEDLVPEQAAGRRVRARLEGLVEERREERQRAHRARPPIGAPPREIAEVGEASDPLVEPPAQGVDRREDRPGARRDRRGPPRRGEHGRGRARGRGLDRQGVVPNGEPLASGDARPRVDADTAAVLGLDGDPGGAGRADLDAAEPSVPRDDHGLDDTPVELAAALAQRGRRVLGAVDGRPERAQRCEEPVGRRRHPAAVRVAVRGLHAVGAGELDQRTRRAPAHASSSRSSMIPRIGVATQSGRLSIS
jgi:hypothetical protein